MSGLRQVTDERGARALADRLNGTARRTPVVVVTIPAGRAAPYIDAARVADDVGDLAEVHLIETGPHGWTFSRLMPDLTQVYGGAGRVYPVGHAWVSAPRLSPLRFAFNATEGQRATEELISDALRMATSAGLVRRSATPSRRRARGEVVGLPVPERALVTVGRTLASVAEELTVPGVPLDRVLAVGMQVEGWLDEATHRFDVTESLALPDALLAAYSPGDVVLAEVLSVQADRATLRLHPQVSVAVARAEVSSNELDDLRSLMSPGEVIAVRVTSGAPHWRISLLDVDDDEVALPAPALLPGGPPWLVESPPAWLEEPGPPEPEMAALPDLVVADQSATTLLPTPEATPEGIPQPGAEPGPEPDAPEAAPPPGPARPTPLLLDRRRERPVPSGRRPDAQTPPAPVQPEQVQPQQIQPVRPAPPARESAAVASYARTVDGLKAEVAELKRRLATLTEQVAGLTSERGLLEHMKDQQARELARADHELRGLRAKLRKAGQRRAPTAPSASGPVFADAEQGFRYAVLTAWARRTPVAEQPSRPLAEYALGPDFLASVREVDGVSVEKVADVVFEVVTGRAATLSGRELHQLRGSVAGGSGYVRRPADGATCWRASLQVNTPQARRLHYWQLPGGRIELSRVARHDDFTP